MLKHPVMYGGQEKRFKLRIKRAYFTQLVDTFSYSLNLIPGSDTAETVDVLVNASEEAIWFFHGFTVGPEQADCRVTLEGFESFTAPTPERKE